MIKLAYCDYIADRIQKLVTREIGDNDTLIESVGKVNYDLHPTEGWLQSTGKTMTVWDTNGKAYLVSVQEAEMLDKD